MSTQHSISAGSPVLIGRASQLALLADLLGQACEGQGCVALIAGEAGIGKSRLIAEVAAIAATRGARSLQGRCFEQDRALPYAPLIDLLRAFCAEQPAKALLPSLGMALAELSKISPDLAAALPDLAPAPALEPEQEKRRLFQAWSQFFQQHAAAQPLLVVVEDLHWCDDTSLEWLLTLARELAGWPLLLLLTYRDDETHPKLNQLLATLDRLPLARELVLPRLALAEIPAMLQAIFELAEPPRAEFSDALYALTDGNPLFIEEVLKSLIAAGGIYREGGSWTRKPLRELHIPRTVQVAVQQRTLQLRAAARRTLTLAAVVGQRFDFGVLQAITQHSEGELLHEIKELIDAHLIIEESAETFAFRHALTHQAIYTGLLGRERKMLHRTVAEALEKVYAGALERRAGELAYQFYEAGLWEQALAWAQRAAEHATRLGAHSAALSHYTRARDCAGQLELPGQVAAIDHTIGKIQRALGQFRLAIEAYAAALQATRDAAQRAALKVDLGEAYVGVADAQGLALLHEALAELHPAEQLHDVARATLWLGRYHHLRAQYSQALGYLERARLLLEPLGDTATLRFVYHYMAAALLFAARFAESIEWTRRCIALGEALQSLPAVAVGYWYLAQNALYQGQWQATFDAANRGQAIVQALVRQAGVRYMMDWAGLPPVSAAYYQGDLANGVRLGRACVRLATEVDDQRAVLWANRMLVLLEAAQGDEQAAHALGEHTLRSADGLIEVTIRCWSRIALAELAIQREEWAHAADLCAQCTELLAGTESHVVQMELGAPMAEAACAQGRLAEAAQQIAGTLALAQATGARYYAAVAWRVQGQVLVAQGRPAEAAQAFDVAIAACAALGSRLELARALEQRGALRHAQRDFAAAQADWARARTICEEIGAQALLWRLHAALGQLALEQQHLAEAERSFAAAGAVAEALAAAMPGEGFRAHLRARAARAIPAELPSVSRRAAKAEFGGLTEREREVVALIAQGRSNREIAEMLVVSERTVTTHIGNIFAKLGFSSRAQVASWAGERGLASPVAE